MHTAKARKINIHLFINFPCPKDLMNEVHHLHLYIKIRVSHRCFKKEGSVETTNTLKIRLCSQSWVAVNAARTFVRDLSNVLIGNFWVANARIIRNWEQNKDQFVLSLCPTEHGTHFLLQAGQIYRVKLRCFNAFSKSFQSNDC